MSDLSFFDGRLVTNAKDTAESRYDLSSFRPLIYWQYWHLAHELNGIQFILQEHFLFFTAATGQGRYSVFAKR